jgi:glycosyltransferase involved in cell wall biosynthesis
MTTGTPRTLHVITALHGGGAERLLTNVVLQEDAPESTSIVSLLPGGVFRPVLEQAGFTVTDLGMRSPLQSLRALFRLAALMREQQPAVVQGWMYHANLLAFLALRLARLRNVRLIWGVFCTDIPAADLTLGLRFVRRANALVSRFVDELVYNADAARDFHRAFGFREKESRIISNSIDADVFRHDARKRRALRRELGIADDTIVVAVVARIDPMKDWSTLRDAVRDLKGVVTVAVGKGTDKLPPQKGFLGLGWRDDVAAILSAADIFLLGSAFGEGLSLALGEAMLCGLPCIVTRVGGNGTLAGDAGIVIEPRDVHAMREAILQLANDRERRELLGRRARQRALDGAARNGAPEEELPAAAVGERWR